MSGNAFHVYSIVEGFGDVQAVRVLLPRIWGEFQPDMLINANRVARIPRGKFINRENERRRKLGQARHYASNKKGGVLILIDAEDECCQEQLNNEMKGVCSDIAEILRDIPHVFVLAEKGYESWIVAGMGGKCSGSPKKWLEKHPKISGLSGKYSGPANQPKVTANSNFDIKKAMKRNVSFQRFVKRMLALPEAGGGGK